ncbi:hypothetical protein ACP8Y2_23215 [Herpetosiphon llansteffanensis]
MSQRLIHTIVLLGYLILAIIATYPLIGHVATHVPSGAGDAAQDLWEKLWNLDHVYRSLLAGQSPFFTDQLYTPNGAALYFHPLSITNAIIALPIIAIWGVIPAYNFLALGSFVLSGYAVYLLCRQWQCSSRSAFLAGMIYSFSAFHFGHLTLNHLELWNMQWLPLYFVAYEQVRQQPSFARIAWAILALLAVLFSSLYMAMYALLWTLVWLGFDLAQQPRSLKQTWQRLRAPLIIGGVTLVVILPLMLIPMLRQAANNPVLIRSVEEVSKRAISPLAIFQRSSLSYLGLIGLVLAVIGVVLTKKQGLRWIVLGLGAFWLALGPRYGLYQIYNLLPIAQFGRYPDRFIVLTLISSAVLAAMGVDGLLKRWQPRWHVLVSASLLLLIGVDSWPNQRPLLQPTHHPVYEQIAADPTAGSVLDMPIRRTNSAWFAMYYQTIHQRPIIDGVLARPVPRIPIFDIRLVRGLEEPELRLPSHDIFPVQQPLAATSYFNLRYLVYYRKSDMPNQQVPTLEQVEALTGATASEIANDQTLVAYRLDWQPSSEPLHTLMELGTGWYELEGSEHDLHRWIKDAGAGATLGLYPTRPMQAQLQLKLVAFDHPQAVDVLLDDQLLATLTVGTAVESFTLPVDLAQKSYKLRFKPHEAGINPSLQQSGADPRTLSISVFEATIQP